MYSTCLFCARDLGANQTLETLPIGRRIAYDEANGRLWVVCRRCERWNLVPFDSRLETIEACERIFRNTRLKFSTGNIGIARVAEGLELVRIGTALRPEFASWRYGDQFGRRRRRTVLYGSAGLLAVGGVYLGGLAVGLSLGTVPNFVNAFAAIYANRKVVARIPVRDGIGGVLTHTELLSGRFRPVGDGWELVFPVRPYQAGKLLELGTPPPTTIVLKGERAMEALTHLLPAINRKGGSTAVVRSAVDLVETMAPGALVQSVVRSRPTASESGWARGKNSLFLRHLPAPVRLAIEMSSHEENERAALAGELKFLERQWREADEMARIADSLTMPENTDQQLQRLRDNPSA